MTKLQVIQTNKARYEKAIADVEAAKPGIEKDVKRFLILEWIKGVNWMGGISDKKFSAIAAKLPYSFDEIYDEFQKQIIEYC